MINANTLKQFCRAMHSATACQLNNERTGELLNLLIESDGSSDEWRLHDEEYDFTLELQDIKSLTKIKGKPNCFRYSADTDEDTGAVFEDIEIFVPTLN